MLFKAIIWIFRVFWIKKADIKSFLNMFLYSLSSQKTHCSCFSFSLILFYSQNTAVAPATISICTQRVCVVSDSWLQISVSHHCSDKSHWADSSWNFLEVAFRFRDYGLLLTWRGVRGQRRGPVRRGAVSHHVGVMRHWWGRGERWMPGNRVLHEFLWH